MAGVWLFASLFLYFSKNFAQSEECVTYNFENDVDSHFFNDTGVCEGMLQGMAVWNSRSYAELWIEAPNSKSELCIAATSTLSCGSTFEFPMNAGGVVEINVYMQSNYYTDQITALVMQKVDDGTDANVGTASIIASSSDYEDGWKTLSITLSSLGTFQGYISIMGMASAKSWVLIDSFRYIPPNADEDSCVIYGDSSESTTQSTTETSITETTAKPTTETSANPTIETTTETFTETSTKQVTEATAETTIETASETNAESTTNPATITTNTYTTTETQDATTEENVDIEECVTYNFESDFDVRFTTDNYLCDGFLPWQLDNYTSIDLESPNPTSHVFMTPHDVASCISTVTFKMEPGGIVEANVFMYEVQPLDHIIILAQRFTGLEYDTVAGFVKYHPGNDIFVAGWNVIRFSLLDLTSFDGYLIFIGSADQNSTVLVDSVRYIPPLTPPEDSSCNLY